MRIGIDIANLSANRSVDVIALATNDTDCIPALKHARHSGLQIALICFPGFRPAPELLAHTDFRREIQSGLRVVLLITTIDSSGGPGAVSDHRAFGS